ncbi:MAG: trigger factor [Acidobacteriota bacterium]
MDIEVQLEEISPVRKKVTVEVPAQEASREFQKILTQFKRMAALPGFRRGKAPLGLIKRQFKKDIEGELYQKLIPPALTEAFEQKELHPLGEPELDDLSYQEGQPLVFSARLEVLPEVRLPVYKGLKVSAPSLNVGDEDLEEELERLRDQNGSLVAVEGRSVDDGDFAVIDLKGCVQAGGSGPASPEAEIQEDGMVVQVGDENTHPAFTRALIGMEAGQEETFEVEYPDDYADKKLAGRKIEYRIRVGEVKIKELPELNDDFAKDLGLESLQELRHKVRQQLEAQRSQNREREAKNALARQILETVSLDVPEVLVQEQIDQKIRQIAYNIGGQGVDPAKAPLDWASVRRDLRPEAENDVRFQLLLTEVARAEDLSPQDEEVQEEILRIAQASGEPVEKVNQRMQEGRGIEDLKSRLERRKALELIYGSAQIEEQS